MDKTTRMMISSETATSEEFEAALDEIKALFPEAEQEAKVLLKSFYKEVSVSIETLYDLQHLCNKSIHGEEYYDAPEMMDLLTAIRTISSVQDPLYFAQDEDQEEKPEETLDAKEYLKQKIVTAIVSAHLENELMDEVESFAWSRCFPNNHIKVFRIGDMYFIEDEVGFYTLDDENNPVSQLENSEWKSNSFCGEIDVNYLQQLKSECENILK